MTQIPALIVSTAAGPPGFRRPGVSGAARQGADQAILRLSAGARHVVRRDAGAVAPAGHPDDFRFLLLGSGAGALAWWAQKQKGIAKAAEAKAAAAPGNCGRRGWRRAAAEEPISSALKIDDLKIELGYALAAVWSNGPDGTDRLTEQIKALRPFARHRNGLRDAVGAHPGQCAARSPPLPPLHHQDQGSGRRAPARSGRTSSWSWTPAAARSRCPASTLPSRPSGLPATWVDASLKEEASLKGYTVVDAATVLSTHLTELLKNNMSDLLSYGEVQKLLKELPKEQSELVKDIVPSLITVSGIQRVLQLLLAERISIRDLSTILEGVADALAFTRSPPAIVEHVRARLARQICAANTSHNGYLPLIALSAKWEQAFAESLIGTGEDRTLAMQPSKLSEFMTAVRDAFERAAREGEAPVLVTSTSIRPFVRSLVERFRAQTTILSQAEIHPRARLKTVGSV